MIKFVGELPKVELHAHLNGSLNIESLKELAGKVCGEQTEEFLSMCNRFIEFKKGDTMEECFKKFEFVHELTTTAFGLQCATEFVIRDFAKDNVMYVELRTTPKANKNLSRRVYLQTVIETIKAVRDMYPIKVKLLPSINRGESLATAEQIVALAIEFSQSDPDIVVGIDFSGNPNHGKFSDFVPMLTKARENKLKLAIHCAEVPNQLEVMQMMKFGMSRCGHGTYLSSSGFDFMKENNIPIECCLTSNVKSGTVASYNVHHLKELIQSNAPIVLCTDDSGLFDTTLSEEFILATETFGLTRYHCIDLTMKAVEYSFATPAEKLKMKMQIYSYTRRQSKE